MLRAVERCVPAVQNRRPSCKPFAASSLAGIAASNRGHRGALALMPGEAAIADLLARLGTLTRLVNTAEGEIRVLAAMPLTPARERRLAVLYRELDAIADEAARIERRLMV